MTTIKIEQGVSAGIDWLKKHWVTGLGVVTGLGAIPSIVRAKAAYDVGKQAVKRFRSETAKVKKGWGEEARRHANFASNAYVSPDKRESVGNWTYMNHISNDRISIYEQGQDWHIALRGTDPTSIKDLMTDVHVATGDYQDKPVEDFMIREQHVKHAFDLHDITHKGDGKISMSGHSLGGTIVAHMMTNPEIAKHVDEAHVFNAGAGPFQRQKYPSKLHMHSNTSDIISFMNDPDNGATHHYHEGGHGMHKDKEHYQDHEDANLEIRAPTEQHHHKSHRPHIPIDHFINDESNLAIDSIVE